MEHRPSILVPFLVCCTGIAFFAMMDAAMKALSLSIGLFDALFWRAVAGSLLGLALTRLLRLPLPARAAMRLHALRGVVVAFMAMSFFWALMRLPLAEAIALSFISPLIALYLAALLLKERVGRAAVVASLLGLAGVAVILGARAGEAQHGPDGLAGAMAMLFSAVLFAWNLILQRQQAQISSPVEVALFQHVVMLAVFAGMAILALIVPPSIARALGGIGAFLLTQQVHLPALHAIPFIVLTAALASVSLALLAWAYARAEAQRLIPVEYTAFLWAAIMGWIVFAEPLKWSTLAGAALIVIGCLIATRRQQTPVPQVETAVA